MRNGEPVAGLAFYELLYSDDDFCKELGRAMLAAGRLETALKLLLENHVSNSQLFKATLGEIIVIAEKESLIPKLLPALKLQKTQRNYVTHNIHPLFAGIVEETILGCSELLDSDVEVFTERASQLAINLNGLANAISHEKST